MILHCVYAAPSAMPPPALLAIAAPGDAVLLLGSAVLAARRGHTASEKWAADDLHLYALKEDLNAYGVTELSDSFTATDYAGWLQLSEAHPLQRVWR